MKDRQGVPDTREDYLWIFVGGLAIALLLAFNTTADAQLRFLATDITGYVDGLSATSETGEELNGVVFDREDVDRMRWASITSVGFDAFGDERLFCGSITDEGRVESIRLVDDIGMSEFTSVSGACRDRFPSQDINFFVHSQPGSEVLSDEDKSLESPVPYSCVIGVEMAVSPVSNRVDGMSCFRVEDQGESFVEVPVYAVN